MPSTQQSRFRGLVYLPVVLAVLVGSGLRLQSLTESLWLDEMHTAWVATGEFHEIVDRAQIGNQSPFYPALVWLSTQTFGENEFAVRLLSWVAGVALIVTSFLVIDRWCQAPLLGGLVAWLIAVDPHSIFFSQEARPYAWVQWFGVLQIAAFAAVLEENTKGRRAAWITTTIILFYLHYTSLLILVGEAVFWCVRKVTRQDGRRDFTTRLVDVGLILLATVPSWSHLWAITGRRGNWSIFVDSPSWLEVVLVFRLDIWIGIPLAILVFLGAIAKLTGFRMWDPKLLAKERLWVIGCCFCVPLLTAWGLTEFDLFRVFFRRYLMVIAALPMLAAGLLGTGLVITGLPSVGPLKPSVRTTYCLLTGLIAAMLLLPTPAFPINGVPHRHSFEDWRGAIGLVNEQASRDWPVFLRAGLIEDRDLRSEKATQELVRYCLYPVRNIYPLDTPDEKLFPLPSQRSWEVSSDEIEAIEQAGGVWLLVRGSPETADHIGTRLVEWLAPRSQLSLSVKRHGFGLLSVLELTATND